MANCKYCGQWAGMFFEEHPLCREAIEAGLPLPEDRRPSGEAAVANALPKPLSLRLSESEMNELAAVVGALAVIAEGHPTAVAESVQNWFVSHGWSKTQSSKPEGILPRTPIPAAPPVQTPKRMSKLAIFWGVLFTVTGVFTFLLIYVVGGTPLQLLTLWALLSLICAVALNALNLRSEK